MKKITLFAVMIVTILSVLLIATPKTATAQFVLASWDYPDEYGQGIDGFYILENTTGVWETWDGDPTGPFFEYDDASAHYFEWNVSVFIKLRVDTYLNSTLLGLTGGHYSEGIPYFRHNVTVTSLGETIFSQANFTFVGADDATYSPMWRYLYEVILNFEPAEGYIYTVTITYEVFY